MKLPQALRMLMVATLMSLLWCSCTIVGAGMGGVVAAGNRSQYRKKISTLPPDAPRPRKPSVAGPVLLGTAIGLVLDVIVIHQAAQDICLGDPCD